MKRIDKKAIYASHGVTYKAGKILYRNRWISELLKRGNTKTGEDVYTWSTTAGTDGTCICNCPGCYAETGFYNMPSVKASLQQNTEIINEDLPFFYNAVSAQLEIIRLEIIAKREEESDSTAIQKELNGEVRINASGDFNSKNPEEYTATWYRIVKENPFFLFWTYTKIRKYETLFDDLPNGNIVKSIINGTGYNFGHCDYIIKVYHMLKKAGKNVYICRCGIDKNQHCQNCRHCATAEFVLFIEHSTGYKAEEDPLFEELKTLIENQ